MRKTKLLLTTLVITAAMNLTVFAGEWKQDSVGWQYQNDDGSYPANGALTANGVVETQTVQEQTVTTQNSQTETPSTP